MCILENWLGLLTHFSQVGHSTQQAAKGGHSPTEDVRQQRRLLVSLGQIGGAR